METLKFLGHTQRGVLTEIAKSMTGKEYYCRKKGHTNASVYTLGNTHYVSLCPECLVSIKTQMKVKIDRLNIVEPIELVKVN